jgi:hypothetical protein
MEVENGALQLFIRRDEELCVLLSKNRIAYNC